MQSDATQQPTTSAPDKPTGSTPDWRLVAVPFAALFLVYLPMLIELFYDLWNDPNYSHGLLVPVVSAVLLWRKREALKALPKSQDRWGLLILIGGGCLFLVANGAAEYFTLRMSFVISLFGLVWYLFGRAFIRATWFELGFLVFMVPVPYVVYYSATVPLQLIAAKISTVLLDSIGMTVARQGNIIYLPGYALEVAEACSGLRSLVSLLALGALYAYLTQRTTTPRLILFLSTIPLAILGNVIRVFITALIAYTVTTDVTAEPLHSILGLIVFVVAFVFLFILSAILKRIFK